MCAVLTLLLLLATITPDSDTGSIWIRTEPGVVVYLNGSRAGVSTPEQGGLWLHGVKPGVHDVRVEVPGAGSSTMKIAVEVGEIVKVPVSSLGIRANEVRRQGELELRVLAPRAGCLARLGARRYPLPGTGLTFGDLAAGKHRLTVSCGSRTLQQDVAVPAGRSILLDIDLVAGTFKVAEDRPLRTQVEVKATRTEVVQAPISSAAKRVLSAALTSDIQVLYLSETLGKVYVEVEAPSASSASNFVDRMKSRPEIDHIEVGSFRMKNVRAIVQLQFTVR
jgi:hypothetical protein